MSSDTLFEKFNELDPQAQNQLLAFWEFLLAQARAPQAIMSETYREQIRHVGVWTDDDVRILEEAASRWHWPVPEW